jgi:hypothetical protein
MAQRVWQRVDVYERPRRRSRHARLRLKSVSPESRTVESRHARESGRTFDGSAPGKIRTCDLCLRRAALYPLSYGRAAVKCSRASAPPISRTASSGISRLT